MSIIKSCRKSNDTINPDVSMILVQRKLGENFYVDELSPHYQPADLLQDIQSKTKCLTSLAVDQVLLALDHDKLRLDHSAFDCWLTMNS